MFISGHSAIPLSDRRSLIFLVLSNPWKYDYHLLYIFFFYAYVKVIARFLELLQEYIPMCIAFLLVKVIVYE